MWRDRANKPISKLRWISQRYPVNSKGIRKEDTEEQKNRMDKEKINDRPNFNVISN